MKKSVVILGISLLSIVLNAANIFLAGDSTCASYPANRAPLTGWGQVLQQFCKDDCKVYNFARSGASSRSFIEKKRWDELIAKVQKGDFVIVQFGHNDSKKNNDRFAAPGAAYDANLKKFIADVRAKGAYPIIATSIARANFKKGKIAPGNLNAYRAACFNVGKAENVPVVDLLVETSNLFNKLGPEETYKLFMCTSGIEKKKDDRTHVKKNGAEAIAKLFAESVKKQNLPVAECFK